MFFRNEANQDLTKGFVLGYLASLGYDSNSTSTVWMSSSYLIICYVMKSKPQVAGFLFGYGLGTFVNNITKAPIRP